MKTYKYILDTSSKKYVCPNCNKKTFVKFIDSETKNYLGKLNGRCDRESKCGYFKKPNNNYNITTTNNCITKVIQPTYHKPTILQQFCNTKQQSNFITYLLLHFDIKKVIQAINMYHIGTTNYWYGATIFWQIDSKNVIRAGKIMLYNSTGKRVKKPYNHVSWIHKQLKLNDFVLNQCLFGLHNTNRIPKGDTICITESEKTAIIMSIHFPDYVWLATGSNTGFKNVMLQPVKEYKIIAYPDKTEYLKWNKTASILNQQGFNIKCSNLLENIDIEDGCDLVDFIN